MRRFLPALALLTACASQPKPLRLLPAPAVALDHSSYSGTPISGPTTRPIAAAASDAAVTVRFVALASMPAVGDALGANARLIIAGNNPSPLLGSPRLTAGVRIVIGQNAKQLAANWSTPSSTVALIGERSALLPAGATAAFSATVDEQVVELRLAAGDFALAIVKPTGTETAMIDSALSSDAPLVLLIPEKLPRTTATVLGIAIHQRRPSGDPALVEQATADLDSSIRSATTRPSVLPPGLSVSAGISAGLAGLKDESHRRASLVFLCDQTSARLCQDVALIADASTMAQLAESIVAATSGIESRQAEALQWTLDHAAFGLLVSLADSPEGGKLSPELAAVLTRIAGEASRHTASLDEIAHGVGSDDDLSKRIIAQNLVFLTDTSPAARVRAFDWLNSRKLAPAGFDPLGSARSRREAIDRATSQP